jgi:hypothetical protein
MAYAAATRVGRAGSRTRSGYGRAGDAPRQRRGEEARNGRPCWYAGATGEAKGAPRQTEERGREREKQKGLPIGEADAGAAIFAGRPWKGSLAWVLGDPGRGGGLAR